MKPTMDSFTTEMNTRHFITWIKHFFLTPLLLKPFSKTYAMTGHRIGYTIANKEVSLAMTKLQGHLTGNNCTFVQYGAIEALKIPSSNLEKQCDEFKKEEIFAMKRFPISFLALNQMERFMFSQK